MWISEPFISSVFSGFPPHLPFALFSRDLLQCGITWSDPSPPADRLILNYSPGMKRKKWWRGLLDASPRGMLAPDSLQPATSSQNLVAVHGTVTSSPSWAPSPQVGLEDLAAGDNGDSHGDLYEIYKEKHPRSRGPPCLFREGLCMSCS